MKSFLLFSVGCISSLILATQADAQVAYVTYYAPAVPVTTYYAPTVPTAVPVTTYYAPAPTVAYRPVPVTTTRYRPILGGTVTRIRTGYAPVVVAPAPVMYGF
jgi:hypothetical protein